MKSSKNPWYQKTMSCLSGTLQKAFIYYHISDNRGVRYFILAIRIAFWYLKESPNDFGFIVDDYSAYSLVVQKI